jgi:hypothetical protein
MINKKDFIISCPVQSSEPVIQAYFTVQIPSEQAVNIKLLNEQYNDFGASFTPAIEKKGDVTVYQWQFAKVPQIIPEPDMPPEVEINPTVLISSFKDWQQIYDWWWGLAKDKMKADEAIKQKVKDLIQGLPSPEAKLKAIHNFCAQKIRYVAVEYGQAGYEPHYAADIFKNKYGDCKDQAILLVTMLKEAGFTAWPVLIPTKDFYNLDKNFPTTLFNHCIAVVEFNEKLIFMDPTSETCSFEDLPPGDQGRKVLICTEHGFKIEETPLFQPGHNLVRQTLDIEVLPDEGITGQRAVYSFGAYDQAQRYWLLYTVPELIKDKLSSRIQAVSIGSLLEDYNVLNLADLNMPVILRYSFKGPEYFTNAGVLRIMPQLGSLDIAAATKQKRRYPVALQILDTKRTEITVNLPKGIVPSYIPENITENNQWLSYDAGYNIKGSLVSFRQELTLKRDRISQNEYSEFKKFLDSLAARIKQRVVLKMGKTR